jgi:hypothetical protein
MISNGSWRTWRLGNFLAAALTLLLSTACAPVADLSSQSGVTETADDPALGPALAAGSCALRSVSGNGLSTNGLTGNGLCQNGLAGQALNLTGLATPSFSPWFNTNPALSDVVMRYLYKCAGASGKSITWKNPKTGLKHTWNGGLGLAPGWTGGATATVAEQQAVTACLGALTNKFGVSVTVAVEGRTAAGTQLTVGPTELADFSVKEGCFFGNLFTGEGIFAGLDHSAFDSKTSSVRACAFDTSGKGTSTLCPPIFQIGYCKDNCVLDATGTFYESCTYNGVTYKPLTTRLKPSDIYTCGDGVCQMTESCGNGADWNNCKADCGPCP